MKSIYNWKQATVADLESDGFLDVATKLHVLGFQMNMKEVRVFSGTTESARIVKFFQWHVDNAIPIVMHNGVSFDVPLMEKLFDIDLSKLMLIDSLAVSWYLNFDRRAHGLGTFHEDYGIEKPAVDDWSDQPYEVYVDRVTKDVEINTALWKDLKQRLIGLYTTVKVEVDAGAVGGKRMDDGEVLPIDNLVGISVEEHINRLLTFLMFKMDCARLQEKTMWEVDVDLLLETEAKLEVVCNITKDELEGAMPKVPQYVKKEAPKKPYKKDQTLSVTGMRWEELMSVYKAKEVDEYGTLKVQATDVKGVYKALNGYEEPSASSPVQVKNLLYSHGWVPISFKYERNDELFNAWIAKKPKEGAHHSKWNEWKDCKPVDRAIPQITVGGDDGKELCESVLELAEQVPEIRKYAEYNVAKHRLGVIKGFIRDLKDGKWLQARIGGFTNTLRVQHRELVNLPGIDKPYGNEIRGVLSSGDGKCLIGSDLCSLENRVAHMLMLPHDPDYVATMQEDDYDAHLQTALMSKLISQAELDEYKKGNKKPHVVKARKVGKVTNYASVYNAGAATIARAAGISVKEGEVLHKGYWELNWSVKAIAEEQCVIRDYKGSKWLVNPFNGFAYALRKESDRFSTLAQGTGSYFFDMWIDNLLMEMEVRYGKKTLTGSFHR